MSQDADILFISHGGGPLPLLGDPGHRELVAQLRKVATALPRPDAILVISAHWEEAAPTVTAAAAPSLIYDYYNFPPASYEIRYPCPGAPVLAQKVHDVLESAGLGPRLDPERGFDHGLFVPLKIMYPDADIPCVQLSLVSDLDADIHLAVGRALSALEADRLLVLGSGFSFHNMGAFFAADTAESRAWNRDFQGWLHQTCADGDLPESERSARFSDWTSAPHARYCHPREEHLLPLHVCYGMAGRACDSHWPVTVLGKASGMFHWRAATARPADSMP